MANTLNAIRIRAHHLLCIQGFQGYGYGRDFIANMAGIAKRIRLDPDLEIQVTDTCDVICSRCPHNEREVCQKASDSAQRVGDLDHLVLEKLDLAGEAKGRARDLLARADARFKDRSDVEEVCGDCEWKQECLWFVSRRK